MNRNTEAVFSFLKEKGLDVQVVNENGLLKAVFAEQQPTLNLMLDCSQCSSSGLQEIKLMAGGWCKVPESRLANAHRLMSLINTRLGSLSYFTRNGEVWAAMTAFCRTEELGDDLYEQMCQLGRQVAAGYPKIKGTLQQ